MQTLKIILMLEWQNDSVTPEQVWNSVQENLSTMHHKGLPFVSIPAPIESSQQGCELETPVEITGWAKV